MYVLPHTHIQVPNLDWRISSYKQLVTDDGVAYQATLRRLNKIVGRASNHGDGGGTWATINQVADRAAFHAYVDQARDSIGKPATEEGVLEDLVSEYEWAARIGRADKAGGTLLRRMTSVRGPAGEPAMAPFAEISVVWSVRLTPLNRGTAVRTMRADQPSGDRHGMGEEITWWQLWNGESWENLTQAPAEC